MILLVWFLSFFSTRVSGSCFDYNTDYPGNDVDDGHYHSVASAELCQIDCQANPVCKFWTWDPNYHEACWQKTAMTGSIPKADLVSGPRYCEPQDDQLRILSYNMFGWNALIQNPWKAENMYKAIRASNPDLLGAQEVEDRANQVAQAIGGGYKVAGSSSAGHAILYKDSVLVFQNWGIEELEEQDQWGLRTMEWAQFTHKTTGKYVDHFNTHLCVCNADDLLSSVKRIADRIYSLRRSNSVVILTGDFNVFDGFEQSKAIQYLTGKLDNCPVQLVDTFRQVNDASVDGTTFPGAGKIDYILTETMIPTSSAWIDHTNYGEASDHLPISAIVDI